MQVRSEPSEGLATYPVSRRLSPAARTMPPAWQRRPVRLAYQPLARSPFAWCHEGMSTADLSAALRAALDVERRSIRNELQADGDALRAIREQSELIDTLIGHLLHLAGRCSRSTIRQTDAGHFAVAAVGGYGRVELAPHSDIDLLFVIPARPRAQDLRAVEFILYQLWDLRLGVGHAVRTVRECLDLAIADHRTATSLLDLRFVGGRRALHDELALGFWAALEDRRHALAQALVSDRAARRARFADAATPHVKLGLGGLRDAQTALWLAKLHSPAPAAAGHPDCLGLLEARARRQYASALGLLWAVRCHLHHLTGRAEECLRPELRAEVARHLPGCTANGRGVTDALLRRWSKATGHISNLCARLCAMATVGGTIQCADQ